jgi:hypothetical protein
MLVDHSFIKYPIHPLRLSRTIAIVYIHVLHYYCGTVPSMATHKSPHDTGPALVSGVAGLTVGGMSLPLHLALRDTN